MTAFISDCEKPVLEFPKCTSALSLCKVGVALLWQKLPERKQQWQLPDMMGFDECETKECRGANPA